MRINAFIIVMEWGIWDFTIVLFCFVLFPKFVDLHQKKGASHNWFKGVSKGT